jgi:DNA-binding transcriptional ArsR family regulator
MRVPEMKGVNKETSEVLNNDSSSLDYTAAKTAAMVMRAINHKLRQQIIRLLEQHRKLPVSEIHVKLRLEQSVASQHLTILRQANLVTTQREGKSIVNSLNYARMAGIVDSIENFLSDGNEKREEKERRANLPQVDSIDSFYDRLKGQYGDVLQKLAQ